MAFYLQQIIPPQFAPNATTTLFTAPVNTTTRIDSLSVTNVDSVAHTITIHLVLSGGSAGSGNTTTFQQTVQPGQTWASGAEPGKVLNTGDFIAVLASAASVLVIAAGGVSQA